MIYLLKEPAPAACRPAPLWTDLSAPATQLTSWDLPSPASWGLPFTAPHSPAWCTSLSHHSPPRSVQCILRHLSLALFPFILTACVELFRDLLNWSSHFLTAGFWFSHPFVFHSTFQEVFQLYLTALGIFSFLLTYLLLSKCSLLGLGMVL